MSRIGRHRQQIPPSRVLSKYFPMEGGLNLTDPALNLRAGEALSSVNYEPVVPRGYRRVEGYERFDGQPKPSAAVYWTITFEHGETEPATGVTLTGSISGATAKLLTKPVVTSGSWSGNDAAGYMVLVDLVGNFSADDILQITGPVTVAEVTNPEEEFGVQNLPLSEQTVPTSATYWILPFENGDVEPEIDDVIRGQDTGTTGVLYAAPVVESGSWATSDAAGFMLIVNVSGVHYVQPEILEIVPELSTDTPTEFATAAEDSQDYGSATAGIHFHYLYLAQEDRRAQIDPVPGVGPVRGVWQYLGEKYAFRDKDPGGGDPVAAGFYKATTSGWVEQTLGYQLEFANATNGVIPEDVVVVGAASGAAATIKRVVKQSGDWSVGDPSSGELVLSGITGTFQCDEQLIADGTVIGEAGGAQTENTLAPGGHYEFHNYNFFGTSGYLRMYGVNGTDTAFEWDGTTFVKIRTGMVEDTPHHLKCYADHLFLAFPGGSLQYSSLGEPLQWNALAGAGEIGTGDEITGMSVEANNVLSIFSRNSAHMLYGTSAADFQLKPYSEHMGAIDWSVQKIGQTWYLDDRGLTTLTLTDTYGDFRQNSVSSKIEPYLRPRMKQVACSQIVRNKNQYRLHFTDGTSIFGTFDGNKVLGFLPVDYEAIPFCSESTEDTDGYEELFFGAEDGYVYQQDIGTSFDGLAIKANILLSYYHYDTPTHNKRFRGIVFEMDVTDNTDIKFLPDFSYGSSEIPRALEQQNEVVGGGGIWDYSLWDRFLWSGQVISYGRNRIDGVGANMGLMVYSESKYLQPYTIQGATVAYSIRRLIR